MTVVATELPVLASERLPEARAMVARHGAVVVRGLDVASAADVAAVADALGIRRMVERERFAPRTELAQGVYSSSEWPADEPMCMHHELSYASEVPSLILFGCLAAADEGGETRVADSQEVIAALPAALVDRFTSDGWLLRRTYHEAGVSWQEAFGTDDPTEVDAYCANAAVTTRWLPDGRLRTTQRRAAVVRHPATGTAVWFNQIAFLNESTIDSDVRDYLATVYGADGLPFNTCHGDGAPVEAAAVETINAAYRDAARGEPWRPGDVLLVDNIRMAHSREPHRGERTVVVVLGDPVQLPDHVLS
jgi:alpha-ketoglutarate-dependent taurine dioxygenase